MIRQIYIEYHLPVMPDDLTMTQIHFFYDALIPELIERQKVAKQMKGGKINGR